MRYRPRSELTRALRTYDLVQVVSGGPALAAVAKYAAVPVVLQTASTVAWERESRPAGQLRVADKWRREMTALTSRIELSALNDVDVVLVYNDILLNHVRALGQQSVIKAPPGVDTDRFTPSPGGWRANGYLLSLCRLNDTRKGLDRMVLAYDQMLRADPEVPDLVLAGKGELPHHMTEMIRGLNLASKVHVRSGVDPSELPRLYQGASVFLLTSHEEGFGMSVLEAMACGLPVVSTETAGTRETVSNGRTGWLVAQDADTVVADEVAKRTLAVLQASGKDLGAQARTRCLSIFSLEVTLHRFIDVYDSLA